MPRLVYDHHVFFCTNKRPDGHEKGCCASKGSEKIRNYMKAKVKELGLPRIRINTAGCLDRCEDGPTVVVYPEGVWYKISSIEEADEFIEMHLQGRGVASCLLLKPLG